MISVQKCFVKIQAFLRFLSGGVVDIRVSFVTAGGALCQSMVVASLAFAQSPTMSSGAVEQNLPEWSLSSQPTLILGGLGSSAEATFSQTGYVIAIGDTLIQVADWREKRIQYFRSDGSFFMSYGRPGGGPGEFTNLGTVIPFRSDTMVAFDSAARRLTFFDLHGNTIRTARIQQPESEFGRPSMLGVAGEGGFYFVFSAAWVGQVEDVLRIPVNIYVVNSEGVPGELLVSFPGSEWVSTSRGNGQSISGQRPFGRRPILFASHGFLYGGDTGVYSVSVFSDQALKRTVNRTVPVQRVTRRDIQNLRTERVDARGTSMAEAERRYPNHLFPETLPVVARVSVDVFGFLWVERFRARANDDHLWDVFDDRGVLVAHASTPASVTISYIGADYVLAVEKGEFDEPLVTRYELHRGDR